MSCFSCFFKPSIKPIVPSDKDPIPEFQPQVNTNNETIRNGANGNMEAKVFTFRELSKATDNFASQNLLRKCGLGRVYKGCLQNTSEIVAVKQLDRNGLQGNKEFHVEIKNLSLLHHPNLVNLVGYCADGDQRLLVYEFLPGGCLEDHLLDLTPDKTPLTWSMRMKIATGAAKGMEYLHDKASPPMVYRDLKCSNVLLDNEYNPKLSDFGLAKLGPVVSDPHVSSRVMGTYGYCAPEYVTSGQLTLKSDVYSFGVLLLEIISGKRASDSSVPMNEQSLVTWAQPILKDKKRYTELVDPLLKNDYSVAAMNQAIAVTSMCLQEEPAVRPLIGDVVHALNFLSLDS